MTTQTTTTKTNAPAPATATAPAPAPASNGAAPATATATAELSLDFISDGGFVLTAELATTTAPVRARSERQLAMDKVVRQLHAKWAATGRHSTWDAMVKAGAVATYFVEPDKSADFHKLINRATTFVKVGEESNIAIRSRMGTAFKVTEQHIAKFKLPAEYLGREAISFAIMDKRPRATTTKPATGKPATQK